MVEDREPEGVDDEQRRRTVAELLAAAEADGAPHPGPSAPPTHHGPPPEGLRRVAPRVVIGELLVAIALGVGLTIAFRYLWDLVPYVAAVLAALAVGVSAATAAAVHRRATGQRLPMSLLVLVASLAALICVLPAALLMAG